MDAVLASQQPGSGSIHGSNGRSLPVVQPLTRQDFCHACFSGDYPIRFAKHPRPRQMRLLDI